MALAPSRPVSFEGAPWVCTVCQNQHTGSQEALNRCDLCGENRRTVKRLAPSRGPSCESQTSERSFESSDGEGDLIDPDEFESELKQLVEDVTKATAAFGSVAYLHPRAAGAPQKIDILLEPARLVQDDVVPKEACTAWGLHPGLRLTLSFESGSTDYGARRLEKATLWHSNPKASGPNDELLLAGSDGCIVAQQLERLVHIFWERLASHSGDSGGGSGGGGGGGGGAGGSTSLQVEEEALAFSGGPIGSTLLVRRVLQPRRADSRPQAEKEALAASGGPIGSTLL